MVEALRFQNMKQTACGFQAVVVVDAVVVLDSFLAVGHLKLVYLKTPVSTRQVPKENATL